MIPKTQQAVNRPYHLSNHTMKKIQIHLIPFLLAAALLLAAMVFPWVKLAEGKSAMSGEIFQSVLRVQTILESEDWKKAVLRNDSREAFTELSTQTHSAKFLLSKFFPHEESKRKPPPRAF